jgi:DNA-directed RNA polymerase subunit M/transcription elongation factor TFIIS
MKFSYLKYKEFLEKAPLYNSLEEKNSIIFSLDPNFSINEIAETLGISGRTEREKLALIFQSRKRSVGETIEIRKKCSKCEHNDFYIIEIDKLFFNEEKEHFDDAPYILIDYFTDLELFENIPNIDDLSLKEIEELEEKISKNTKFIFDLETSIKCRKCGNEMKIIIDYKQILSKFTIKNIYEQYLDITQFSNMNKKDVDEMYPFEREIFMGLIQERQDKKLENSGKG